MTIGAVLLDIDWQFFVLAFTKENEDTYQRIDKALDFYWYSTAFVFSLRSSLWQVFFVLFAIRLAGEILFYLKNDRKVFLYFPNVFENLFIFYIFTLKFPVLEPWLEGTWLGIVIFVLAALKMIQEYLAHKALFDFPTWVRSFFSVGADLRVRPKKGRHRDRPLQE